MRARVHDKKAGKYFKSEIYAIISVGWFTRYLVKDTDYYFRLVDALDKSGNGPLYPVLVNIITPERPDEWIREKDASLAKINALLAGEEIRFDYFAGYPWVFEASATLAKLLRGEKVDVAESGFPAVDTKLPGWCYVETQDDAESLMREVYGFHDSVLKSLDYISGACVDENKSMFPLDSVRTLRMVIGSQWSDTIELVFEGLVALNLRPSDDNYDCIIMCASIFLKDETAFWSNAEMEKEDWPPECTCAKAYSLRWRWLPAQSTFRRGELWTPAQPTKHESR